MNYVLVRRFVLVCFFSSFAIPTAWAGSISLETQITASLKGHRLETSIHITNRGTESAYNVQIKPDSLTVPKDSPLISVLPVGQSTSAIFREPLNGFSPGRYAFIVRMLYADANMYPFSALAMTYFVHQKDAIPDLLGTLGKCVVQRQGHLHLVLKNPATQAKDLHIRLFLPQELSSDMTAQQLMLASNEEKTLSFPVHNFSALEGSKYAVYAVVEYEQEGLHYTVVIPGFIEISGEKLMQQYLIPVLVFLAFLIAFFNVRFAPKKK